jgi:phosphopantetheinyl transferase (holo-ACP synthase)
MIGIDLTTISRFESIDLGRLGLTLGQALNNPRHAAKVWCCLEALIKARGSSFDFKKIKLIFDVGQPPRVEDVDNVLGGQYVLSLSHEGDLVTAVALRKDI